MFEFNLQFTTILGVIINTLLKGEEENSDIKLVVGKL